MAYGETSWSWIVAAKSSVAKDLPPRAARPAAKVKRPPPSTLGNVGFDHSQG